MTTFTLILVIASEVCTLRFNSLQACLADQHRAEAGEVRIIRDCSGAWR